MIFRRRRAKHQDQEPEMEKSVEQVRLQEYVAQVTEKVEAAKAELARMFATPKEPNGTR